MEAHDMLPLPHGGKLIQIPDLSRNKFSKGDLRQTLEISYETAVTIMGIKTGILSPLEGFLGYSDYESVLRGQCCCAGDAEKRYAWGHVWHSRHYSESKWPAVQ